MSSIVRLINNNNEGYAMVVTMLMLLMLTVIGIAATNTSNIEVQISSNAKEITEDFYTTEGGLYQGLEMSNDPVTPWLTTGFLTAGQTTASFFTQVDFDNNGTNDTLLEVRCIESTATAIGALSGNANNIPPDNHLGPPPVNSGYSLRYFQIRKYAVTSTALRAPTTVQAGAWKVFNKFGN